MKIAHLVLSNVYAGIEQHVNELILEPVSYTHLRAHET